MGKNRAGMGKMELEWGKMGMGWEKWERKGLGGGKCGKNGSEGEEIPT